MNPDKLAKENIELYDKNEYLEKKIAQPENWNSTLKTEILSKMNTRTVPS